MTFETLILTIENYNLNTHSVPWIKSDRDSIRNSCDVLKQYPLFDNVFLLNVNMNLLSEAKVCHFSPKVPIEKNISCSKVSVHQEVGLQIWHPWKWQQYHIDAGVIILSSWQSSWWQSTSDDIHAPADQPWKLWHLFKLLFVLCPLKYCPCHLLSLSPISFYLQLHHLSRSLDKLKRFQVVS